jgi:hypothetical protein
MPTPHRVALHRPFAWLKPLTEGLVAAAEGQSLQQLVRWARVERRAGPRYWSTANPERMASKSSATLKSGNWPIELAVVERRSAVPDRTFPVLPHDVLEQGHEGRGRRRCVQFEQTLDQSFGRVAARSIGAPSIPPPSPTPAG